MLITLNILTFAITIGNLNNILHTILQKNNINTNNYCVVKTQQDTKYIDKFSKITTNETNFSNTIAKEITQIEFYQNEKNEIHAIIMPKSIEKVTNQLPSEIIFLNNMFFGVANFNQDISSWDTSNITNKVFNFNKINNNFK